MSMDEILAFLQSNPGEHLHTDIAKALGANPVTQLVRKLKEVSDRIAEKENIVMELNFIIRSE